MYKHHVPSQYYARKTIVIPHLKSVEDKLRSFMIPPDCKMTATAHAQDN